jgi:hypothetical protein
MGERVQGVRSARPVDTVSSERVGRARLDRITESLLGQFSRENGLADLPESKRFEHFAAFAMIRRHYSRSFATDDVVLGGGNDTGIDAIAMIVNNNIVTDLDAVHDLVKQNDYVDVTFVFIQAERSPSFSGSKVGNFGVGVVDFFATTPKLPRSAEIQALAEITDLVLGEYAPVLRSSKCFLYYVTTGLWTSDANLVGRRDNVVEDLMALSIFDAPQMFCVGAAELHDAYRRTKNPIQRTFVFDRRVDIPSSDGVIQATLGFVPFSEFKKLIEDEGGTEILTSIFEDNVRDWQGWKSVNSGIRNTLQSDQRSKFVLMNNGVTIITRNLTRVGEKFTISDYQIVNGCQSSNVLFEERDQIGDDVTVPLRLVHTSDDTIKELITTATNSQTDIKPEQFASRRNFARGLEQFFATFPEEHRLYYERRDGQYDRGSEPKIRVIDIATVLRSYASIFWETPHAAAKSYASIRDQVGATIFVEGHSYWPYYYASYAWFLLDGYYRSKFVDPKYKSARWHILMAVHLQLDNGTKSFPNSKEIEQRAEAAMKKLWQPAAAEKAFTAAVELIDEVTGGILERDHVRTEAVTNAIVDKLRPQKSV